MFEEYYGKYRGNNLLLLLLFCIENNNSDRKREREKRIRCMKFVTTATVYLKSYISIDTTTTVFVFVRIPENLSLREKET